MRAQGFSAVRDQEGFRDLGERNNEGFPGGLFIFSVSRTFRELADWDLGLRASSECLQNKGSLEDSMESMGFYLGFASEFMDCVHMVQDLRLACVSVEEGSPRDTGFQDLEVRIVGFQVFGFKGSGFGYRVTCSEFGVLAPQPARGSCQLRWP